VEKNPVVLFYSKGHASFSAKPISLKWWAFFKELYPTVAVGEWFNLHKRRGCKYRVSQLSVNSVFIL